MKRYLLLAIASLTLTGCLHQRKVPYSTLAQNHPVFGPRIEEAKHAGTIPIKNEANVRLPGNVKAYAVNRYIDPANPRIMHERHVLYRVEADPTWRLSTDEKRQILVGNTLTNGKLNYAPALMQKELALELKTQRINNQALLGASETVIDTAVSLSQENEILMERSEQLRKALIKQNKVNEELESRLNMSQLKGTSN